MFLLKEYTIIKTINLNGNKLIYRAENFKDKHKAILKILENVDPRSNDAAGFINEYEIAGNFSFKGIPHFLRLERYSNKTISIIEDIDGISLEDYIEKYNFNTESFIKLAINIT